MEDYALASLKLVTMEASVNMSSNNEVNLKATMKDIALCDVQKGKQDRITGYVQCHVYGWVGVLYIWH